MEVVRELIGGGAGGRSAALCTAAEHSHLEVAHHPSTCNALYNTHLDERPPRAPASHACPPRTLAIGPAPDVEFVLPSCSSVGIPLPAENLYREVRPKPLFVILDVNSPTAGGIRRARSLEVVRLSLGPASDVELAAAIDSPPQRNCTPVPGLRSCHPPPLRTLLALRGRRPCPFFAAAS